jgi:hypothetical protein
VSAIPKGLEHSAQGCGLPRRSAAKAGQVATLGAKTGKSQLRKSCISSTRRCDATPFRVVNYNTATQGRPSRNRANPGLNDCNPVRIAAKADKMSGL